MPTKVQSGNKATYSSHDNMLLIDSWGNDIKLDFTRRGKVVALNLSFDAVVDYPIRDKDKLYGSLKSLFADALEEIESDIETWLTSKS